jgi:amino-acid N-acetyltransferase
LNNNLSIRKAKAPDVDQIADLINYHAQKGIMLPRPISRIYDNIRDYQVVEAEESIIACCALHITWSDLAEIRSLAVRDEYMRQGIGKMMVARCLNEARELEVGRVFALTYQDKFFMKLGFNEVDKAELPHKIWNECINCIHFPNCNEIAMIKYLDGETVYD